MQLDRETCYPISEYEIRLLAVCENGRTTSAKIKEILERVPCYSPSNRLVYVGHSIYNENSVRVFNGAVIYAPIGSPYYDSSKMGIDLPDEIYIK